MAISLGSTGWNIGRTLFMPRSQDRLFSYWASALEPPLHAVTGAMVGAGVARRMFMKDQASVISILMPPALVRAVVYLATMAPFNTGAFTPSVPQEEYLFVRHHLHTHILHRDPKVDFISPAAVTSWGALVLMYSLATCVLAITCVIAFQQVRRVMAEFEEKGEARGSVIASYEQL